MSAPCSGLHGGENSLPCLSSDLHTYTSAHQISKWMLLKTVSHTCIYIIHLLLDLLSVIITRSRTFLASGKFLVYFSPASSFLPSRTQCCPKPCPGFLFIFKGHILIMYVSLNTILQLDLFITLVWKIILLVLCDFSLHLTMFTWEFIQDDICICSYQVPKPCGSPVIHTLYLLLVLI